MFFVLRLVLIVVTAYHYYRGPKVSTMSGCIGVVDILAHNFTIGEWMNLLHNFWYGIYRRAHRGRLLRILGM